MIFPPVLSVSCQMHKPSLPFCFCRTGTEAACKSAQGAISAEARFAPAGRSAAKFPLSTSTRRRSPPSGQDAGRLGPLRTGEGFHAHSARLRIRDTAWQPHCSGRSGRTDGPGRSGAGRTAGPLPAQGSARSAPRGAGAPEVEDARGGRGAGESGSCGGGGNAGGGRGRRALAPRGRCKGRARDGGGRGGGARARSAPDTPGRLNGGWEGVGGAGSSDAGGGGGEPERGVPLPGLAAGA